MSEQEEKCRYCDNEATLLCDGTLPRWMMNPADRAEHLKGRMLTEVPTTTCDAPLCEKCAYRMSTTFWSGKAGCVTTEDLCPECCKHHWLAPNPTSKWRLKPTK